VITLVFQAAIRRARCSGTKASDQAQFSIDDLVARLGETLVLARPPSPVARFEPVDLTGLVTASIERHDAQRVRLGLKPTADPPPLYALGDTSQIARVLDVLIANALSYGARATVHLDRGTTMLVAHVDDTGPGVPRSEREHVFQASYYTATQPTLRPHGRAELVGARQIARTLGGDIRVSASPDGGARFTLRLPLLGAQETGLAKAS
jgi:signal transduction histidine kinase